MPGIKGQHQAVGKETSDLRDLGWAHSQPLPSGKPAWHLIHPCARWSSQVAPWKLSSPFTDGNYHHLHRDACLSALWGIHHALLTWRGPHLVYVPGHADKSPGYHGEHSAKDSIPRQQRGGALPGLYTHTHTGTNPPGRLNHLERQAPSWASRAFLRVPWPSYQVLCHAAATRPPGQQPSRCQANFSTQPGFLSAPDRHHVSQQENTHSSTLQNAPDVIKAREAKETKDGLFGRGRS